MSRGPVHLPLRDQGLRQALGTSFRRTAFVAAAFVAIVAVAMGVILARGQSVDLATQTPLEPLKQQLAAHSGGAGDSGALKAAIRDQDERLRVAWFARRAMLAHGAWLLIGGMAVLVLSGKAAWDLSVGPYLPSGPAPDDAATAARVIRALCVGGVVIGAALLLLFLPAYRGTSFESVRASVQAPVTPALPLSRAALTVSLPAVAAPAPVVIPLPADAWPAFRGAGGIGVTTGDYPTEWNNATGKNIVWKTPVPLAGNSSPIVCAGRVFLTGGAPDRREVYCFDAVSGAVRWARQVGSTGGPAPKLAASTGWAPSTMAGDGARVFAIFPTGDLACFDLDGKPIWSKTLGLPVNPYGHASSLLAWQGMLFVQLDQGATVKEASAAMFAFSAATGAQVWKTPRPVMASWSTPALVKGPGGPQLVALGYPWVIGYEPASGAEIWRAGGLAGEIAPSPTFAGGFVYAATESGLLQIRIDGHGDVTATHVTKVDSDALPDIVSPVAVGSRVLLVQTSGTVALSDPKAGKDVWTHDFESGFHASPVAVSNRVYLTDDAGVTHVIEAADSFKEISAAPLGQAVTATPAFSAGRIYIRGQKDLFCIAQ